MQFAIYMITMLHRLRQKYYFNLLYLILYQSMILY